MRRSACAALVALAFLAAPSASAGTVRIAVASNFTDVLRELQPAYERESGDRLLISSGSSGQLLAQIRHAAPYDVLLAADSRYALAAVQAGVAEGDSRFTYAIGRLALYTANPSFEADPAAIASVRTLAIANPDIAPYGAAAREVLQGMQLWDKLEGRIAYAQSVSGAFAMAHSRAADMAFVACSAVCVPGGRFSGRYWLVPRELHQPLHQDAVLLMHGRGNDAASRFLKWLRTPDAQARIVQFGYESEP